MLRQLGDSRAARHEPQESLIRGKFPSRSPHVSRFAATVIAFSLLTATGCRVQGNSGQRPAPARPTELAARPGPLPPDAKSKPQSGSSSPGLELAEPTPAARSRSFTVIAEIDDASGDAGPSPDHADLASVSLMEDGEHIRITVRVYGPVPAVLGDGEVIGIGVNLFADSTSIESEYQVFADGGPEGWFAYFSSPAGVTEYPGEFWIDADRLVFDVPSASIGPFRQFDSFSDWSSGGLLSHSGEDLAPDRGRVNLDTHE